MLHPEMLHVYQDDLAMHMIENNHSMNWADMGLGKTVSLLTAIAFINNFIEKASWLIVAPKTVCQLTWRQEAEKWSHANNLKFSSILGTEKKRQKALFTSADVYLTNYENLVWITAQLQHYFINQNKQMPFKHICFDEVSKLKHSTSNRFKEFKKILMHFERRVGLTASPASNGYENLFGQFYVVDEGKRLGTSFYKFRERYFNSIDFGNFKKYEARFDTKDRIINKVKDITIELAANDYLDMPEFIVIDRVIELPQRKFKKYKGLEKDFFIELDSGKPLEVNSKVDMANKLLQFTSGIIYNKIDEFGDEVEEEFIHDAKYKELDEILELTGDSPILLAYNFQSEKKELLKRYKDIAECMTGASEKEVVDMVERFNRGEIKLLIGHPASMGHGLNLQASCHILVWFGLNYNLEYYEQFNGRVNRQGQKNAVQCFRIIAKDTIDLVVINAVENKDKEQNDLKTAISDYRNQELKLVA